MTINSSKKASSQAEEAEKFKLLYHNFDGLEVSFKGSVSKDTLRLLELGKESAKADGCGIVKFNPEFSAQVFPNGTNGYAFIFSTGEDGETWFIKDSLDSGMPEDDKGFNIRVSVNSGAFPQYGYKGVKKRIYDRLKEMGCNPIRESVGRVDYCVDYLAPEFKLNPENFVTHSRTKTSVEHYGTVYQGRRCTYVRAGNNPNRSVVIYDKRGEVVDKKKDYWWQVWGIDKSDKKNKVWRVEFRFFKNHLRKKWNLRSFAEIEACMGDIMAYTLRKVRYVENPEQSSNITYCDNHELWHKIKDIVEFNFDFTGLVPDGVTNAMTIKKFNCLSLQMAGILTKISYYIGMREEDVKELPQLAEAFMRRHMENNEDKAIENYRKAARTCVFDSEKEFAGMYYQATAYRKKEKLQKYFKNPDNTFFFKNYNNEGIHYAA